MINSLRQAWRKNRLLTIAFLALCLITLFLAVRISLSAIYWSNHRDLPIEPWMRLGYIGRSHGVEVERLRDAINLPTDQRERRTLSEIAAQRQVSIEELIKELSAAIELAKQERKR